MTSTFKRYDQMDADFFRRIILGEDVETNEDPVQAGTTRPMGLMTPETGVREPSLERALGPRDPSQRMDPNLRSTSDNILTRAASALGAFSTDRQQVADAIVPRQEDPPQIDLSEWESLPPLEDTLDLRRSAAIDAQLQAMNRDAVGIRESLRPAATQEPAIQSEGISTLLDFIGTGEGTYDSYNSGTVNNVIQHSSSEYSINDTPLSSMTIGQIKEQMQISDPTNPERIFAAGKYQAAGDTFDAAVESLGLSDDTVFNQETQDRIGLYLLSEKRPRVGRYIEGGDISTETAMLDLAMEFASFPVPYAISQGTFGQYPLRDIQAGESFYSTAEGGRGTNRASHTVEETRTLLESIRGEPVSFAPESSLVPRPRPSSAPETSPVPQPRPVVDVPEEQIQQAETPTEVTTAVAQNMPTEARMNPAQYIFNQGYIGLDENNPAHQATIQGFMTRAAGDWLAPTPAHATTRAWCAAFVDDVLVNLGAPRADEFAAISDAGEVQRVRAREYLNYGSAVDGISNAQPGDIVVIRPPDSNQYHVGFFTGMDSEGRALILGGNQSNAVNVTPYSLDKVQGVRRIENVAEIDPDTLKEITTGFALGAADGSTR